MTTRERMLLESKVWMLEKQTIDKHYFKNLSRHIKPNVLWIDSSDNLVAVAELTNTDPGEILVHRNLATLVRSDDISLMASLEHAIGRSRIEYIIVCGYSNCTGVREVISGNDMKPHVKKWLEELREMYHHQAPLMAGLSSHQKEKRLCEINIQQQIINLSNMDIVQQAWKDGRNLSLLGWYFDLQKGAIQEIFSMKTQDLLFQVAQVT
ncbi:MAG TPA: carbonic anhydrase [Chryseolinea sp.]|nr:carbonic anhydrase [Chryseolinea sp.]